MGIGRGEEMLKWELEELGSDVELKGGSSSYDIAETIEGSTLRWEVKEVDSSLSIRPGTNGRIAVSELIRKIKEILLTLKTAYGLLSREPQQQLERLIGLPYELVWSFLDVAQFKAEKGEVSKGLFHGGTTANPIGLMQIVRALSSFIVARRDKVVTSSKFYQIPGVNKLVTVNQREYFDDLVRFHLFNLNDLNTSDLHKEMLQDMGVTEIDLFAARLRDPSILKIMEKPDTLEDLWKTSVTASETFSEVDGIILVSQQEGWARIMADEFNKMVVFNRITQNNSQFKIVPAILY
jgi:hypothetical protein